MYTLEHLQQKSLKELKEIGSQLNVLSAGDRRYRQSWIDAIAGVNPPLLQLLEVSPGVEVDRAQEPIIETVEPSPAVEVDRAQEPIIETVEISPAVEVDRAQEPIIETVEPSPAADGVQSQEPPIESKFGRIVYPRPAQGAIPQVAKTSPGVELDSVEKPFIEAVETSLGVEDYLNIEELLKLDHADCPACGGIDSLGAKWSQDFANGYWIISCEKCNSTCNCSIEKLPPYLWGDDDDDSENSPGNDAPKCSNCFDDGYVEDAFGVVNFCQCESKLSRQKTQSAIAPAVNISNSDQNPILTGIALSDRFLTRYSPPQPEKIYYQADADGQLSLLNFEVESVDEPPDPDDFESLDAFREAIALWDAQNPEPIDVSLDSMCEWAPCPEEWYEPEPESLPLKASSMVELSPPVIECSITSANFTIPTFDAWCDRAKRQTDTDEPPDTGFFARLPKPKSPTFPPQAARWTQVGQKSTASQPLHCVVAGSSTQPARSPPGGDAMP